MRSSSCDGPAIRKCHSAAESEYKSSLASLLKQRIRIGGPLRISDYMKYALTNPVSGYYMNRDVFGVDGDFITSPEISQMFGELVAIWCLNEWLQRGNTEHLQLVELGPGRGTLADDMLRALSQFEQTENKISLHLIEVSDKMTSMQSAKLCSNNHSEDVKINNDGCKYYKSCMTKYNIPVYWYKDLVDVPNRFSCFVAQEFFDALPIHKFQLTERGWCEVCIDHDTSTDSFKYALSKSPTLWSHIFVKEHLIKGRTHIEISPEGAAIAETVATKIANHGGAAIIADYGHNGENSDTFRSFRKHQLHDPLADPGMADLTADVDFSYLNNTVSDIVTSHGPVTQTSFLTNMGIGLRLKMLMTKAGEETRANLMSGFRMLMDADQMGHRFKFFAMTSKCDPHYVPAGFRNIDV